MSAVASSVSVNPKQPLGRVAVGSGIELQVRVHGSGNPILMLHGFPDHAGTWRGLADLLAPQFRLIMPDLRGYGLSSRPSTIADYRMNLLVGDLIGLLDVLGLDQVYLCGHDWGGLLAYELARQMPERIAGLVALNAPPPQVLQNMIWHDPAQRAASQYISMLRSPAADAIFCESNVDALIERFLGEPRRRGLLSDEDLVAYRQAWTQPGVWQAMLAWYRAAPFDVPQVDTTVAPSLGAKASLELPNVPVQVIWGDRDAVFVPAMPDAIADFWPDCRVERIAEAGHVPHRDAPNHCFEIIRGFLSHHPLQVAQKD
jgi:pimeloyl-ACP methyl ester carboxylesterase